MLAAAAGVALTMQIWDAEVPNAKPSRQSFFSIEAVWVMPDFRLGRKVKGDALVGFCCQGLGSMVIAW
jgi:hypothetical protein